jgi:cell division protein FtsL
MQAQATQLIHAYKQAPWRVQRQYVGAFLLVVIGLAMIAALYLQVTARAAATGRNIQEMRLQVTAIQRGNADLETQLAKLTSAAEMQRRALELGFRPVTPGELDYIAVPGFVAPEPEILLKAVDAGYFPQPMPEEYSQSLIEWFNERLVLGRAR